MAERLTPATLKCSKICSVPFLSGAAVLARRWYRPRAAIRCRAFLISSGIWFRVTSGRMSRGWGLALHWANGRRIWHLSVFAACETAALLTHCSGFLMAAPPPSSFPVRSHVQPQSFGRLVQLTIVLSGTCLCRVWSWLCWLCPVHSRCGGLQREMVLSFYPSSAFP